MKKLLIIPAVLGAAVCALAGCEMVNSTEKTVPNEKIVAPQTDETCPDCPENGGEGEENPVPEPAPENPDECPDCPPNKWIRDRFPRRKRGGDNRAPQPDKNFRRKG